MGNAPLGKLVPLSFRLAIDDLGSAEASVGGSQEHRMSAESLHPSTALSRASSGPSVGVVPVVSFDSARGAALWVSLTFMAAAAGGLGSTDAPSFYRSLALPDWAPPASVFGPVWSVLYLLMALSAW